MRGLAEPPRNAHLRQVFTPTVAVRLYRPIVLELYKRGIPAEPLLAEFGMPPPETVGWDVRLPLPQIAGLWDRLLAITGDRSFPLQAAEHVDLTTCDVITYLEGNAKTVREALEKKFEYLALITDAIAWTLEESGGEALLTLHERPPRPPLAPVAEFLVGSRHVFFARFGPPDWRPRFVSFRHASPGDTAPFVRIFGVTPRFNAAEDQIGFDASLLDQPMRGRDDALSELLGRYAEQMRGALPTNATLSERVRDALRGGVDPGIAAVAQRLGLSARTLQRTLEKEGTTYLKIAERARCAAAEQLLLRRELSVSEVAYALGFNDVPAFHHAFRRWTGSTPGGFRARSLGAGFTEPTFGRLRKGAEPSRRSEDAPTRTTAPMQSSPTR